jgi:hypothetical protein
MIPNFQDFQFASGIPMGIPAAGIHKFLKTNKRGPFRRASARARPAGTVLNFFFEKT